MDERRHSRKMSSNSTMQPHWGSTSGWGLKLCWVGVHALCVALLLVLDSDLRRHTLQFSWYAGLYYMLLLVTVWQYYYTVGSSPGYVLDLIAEKEEFEANAKAALDANISAAPWLSRSASSSQQNGLVKSVGSSGNVAITVSDTTPLLRGPSEPGPPSTNICSRTLFSQPSFPSEGGVGRCPYCHAVQPLRSKHCYDCEKCVMRFDHHCVWLGTCVGQFNHRRFWWYIFFETGLTLWTTVLYGSTFSKNSKNNWFLHDSGVLAILLGLITCLTFLATLLIFHTYLAVTNQTTYEKTRRRRITYLKSLPAHVNPFSEGIISNTYTFCCAPYSTCPIYSLPTAEEIEAARHRKLSCFGT